MVPQEVKRERKQGSFPKITHGIAKISTFLQCLGSHSTVEVKICFPSFKLKNQGQIIQYAPIRVTGICPL
jgi:hypothetical protein